MKYSVFLLLISLLYSCSKPSEIEFNGNVPGVTSGVFIIKDLKDSTIYGVNIKNGKFQIKKQLDHPGYYYMDISDDADKTKHDPFEVYLEAGKYIVETQNGKIYKYPKITSPSTTQKQLSDYYELANAMNSDIHLQIDIIKKKLDDKSLSKEAFNILVRKLSAAQINELAENAQAFKKYIETYPKSTVSAHLMAKLDYEQEPQIYSALFNKLDSTAKNSEDGKEVGGKLAHLMHLVPGAKAPAIVGTTPDGKAFDPTSINKKFILVDFWRSNNQVSRMNHHQLALNGKIAMVSVSIDSKADWWKSAIKDDKLTWTQISDLKGDDSPNVTNWAIERVPTYYLLDNNWNVIERDIAPGNIDLAISDYLKKHR
jgi:hypothetical protein